MEKYFRNLGTEGISIDGNNDILPVAYADDMGILCKSPIDVKKKSNLLEKYGE